MLNRSPRTIALETIQNAKDAPKRSVRARIVCVLTVFALALVAFVPNAQAIYIEFGAAGEPGADRTVDIELDGHSISIIDEIRTVTIDGGEYGFRMQYDVQVTTVRFNDGPVMLSSVEFDNPNQRATIDGPDGVRSVLAGAAVDQFVSSVQAVGFFTPTIGDTAAASVGGINVDLARPVSAIPEPGAAMLFAAGIGFVALRTRRD